MASKRKQNRTAGDRHVDIKHNCGHDGVAIGQGETDTSAEVLLQQSQPCQQCRFNAIVHNYDYEHQAWVKGGVYQDCGHPQSMQCNCYGRLHHGEQHNPS